jgi:hypothetical protein
MIMPDHSLVPVDYQPGFDDHSLVPVDYDPFAADGPAQQAQIQLAQAQPQQQPPVGAGQPDAAAPAATGELTPLKENGRVDSYVYKKLSTGTPPAGPQVTTAKGNLTITATDGAKHTNFGGVYGHTLTVSEPASNDLGTVTAAEPTGLLVATPVEGDPNLLSVREYKATRPVYS